MFDYDPPKKKEPTDYTGLKILAILAPVFLLFIYLGKADLGLTATIVLGMIILVITIRWNLRTFLFTANRNRGFFDCPGSCWTRRKALLERFFFYLMKMQKSVGTKTLRF